PAQFVNTGDSLGWVRGDDALHHLTLYVPAGRVNDTERGRFRAGINEIAKIHDGDMRVTGNSNLIIGRVRAENVAAIDAIVKEYGLDLYEGLRPLRRNAMTCVAFPTCGLA